jgi:hypothetical protein
MNGLVAAGAERDEVLFGVLPLVATRPKVMHLEMLSSTTMLTAPTIPRQNLSLKSTILFAVESERRSFWLSAIHIGLTIAWVNLRFCSDGRIS